MTDVSRERVEQVIALLQSRDDGLPESAPRSVPSRGFSHRVEVVVDCPDCLERRLDGESTFGCETCGGASVTRSFRERDPYAVEAVQPFGLTPDRHEGRRLRDAELGRLELQTKPPFASPEDELADANRHPFGWELERKRRYAKWDFGSLDLALDALRLCDEEAAHALHSVYVYGYVDVCVSLEVALLRGLVFVALRMPDPIRAPGFETDPERRVVGRRGRAA